MTDKNTPPDAAGLGIWGNLGIWIAFGSLFGVVAGILFDNLALCIALGTSLGVVAGTVFIGRRNTHSGS
ncbi:hypothetical protein [Actinoplanes sp. DH11]|uniref:hypothetical protein n=1 Tax=Actinoplanes sp. DH11 TaxID=2857011 RepID=UPI001E5DEAE8|nr:hypothetical protein [Actinoplanes sp. DH11]